jgi:hypothetical protein
VRTSADRKFQLTTDGLNAYNYAVGTQFWDRVDYAQLIKIYTQETPRFQHEIHDRVAVDARNPLRAPNAVALYEQLKREQNGGIFDSLFGPKEILLYLAFAERLSAARRDTAEGHRRAFRLSRRSHHSG